MAGGCQEAADPSLCYCSLGRNLPDADSDSASGFSDPQYQEPGQLYYGSDYAVLGTILADGGFKNIISRITLMYSCIRLIAIPIVVMLGCFLCHVDATVAGVSVVLAAMPMGNMTTMLAAKYEGDVRFATQAIVVSAVLSMVVLPV